MRSHVLSGWPTVAALALQEAVSEASNQLADAGLRRREVYRDKGGGTKADWSNKGARCVP